MREPSEPFERRGGDDQQTALFNRISALKRIEFLSGVDLAKESAEFKKLIDSELYTRWYKDYSQDHCIDEIWCNRVAEVVKELKGKPQEEVQVMEEGADDLVKSLYKEAKLRGSIPTEQNKVAEAEKISLFRKILNWTLKK